MGLDIREQDRLVYSMTENRRLSNFFWAFFTFLGSLGLLVVAISSYLGMDMFFISEEICYFPFIPDFFYFPFIPQGATMGFYGMAGLFCSVFLGSIILWDVGGGSDTFDKKKKIVRFIRHGFPGTNSNSILEIPMNELQSIRIITKVKEEGIFTRTMTFESIVYLETRYHGFIPLTRLEDDLTPAEIAHKAGELSVFLGLPLFY